MKLDIASTASRWMPLRPGAPGQGRARQEKSARNSSELLPRQQLSSLYIVPSAPKSSPGKPSQYAQRCDYQMLWGHYAEAQNCSKTGRKPKRRGGSAMWKYLRKRTGSTEAGLTGYPINKITGNYSALIKYTWCKILQTFPAGTFSFPLEGKVV